MGYEKKIALRPYLEQVTGICAGLSREELGEVILSLAKEVRMDGRMEFLDKLQAYLPHRQSVLQPPRI